MLEKIHVGVLMVMLAYAAKKVSASNVNRSFNQLPTCRNSQNRNNANVLGDS